MFGKTKLLSVAGVVVCILQSNAESRCIKLMIDNQSTSAVCISYGYCSGNKLQSNPLKVPASWRVDSLDIAPSDKVRVYDCEGGSSYIEAPPPLGDKIEFACKNQDGKVSCSRR